MALQRPIWQPITQLPLITSIIDGMLQAAKENYQSLQLAGSKPHVLDDATVKRVINVYTAQRDDLWLFEEQARRWIADPLAADQRQEVKRLTDQVAQLREVLVEILALADQLKRCTLEQVLAKSDEELALAVLRGRTRPNG